MRISEHWLREWVDPPLDSQSLAEQLTMAGLEVDAVMAAGADFTRVVVGQVVDLHPHPDAERLRIAQVKVSSTQTLHIVCGADNVRVGLCAPTALAGAELPGGVTIADTEMRGVISQGMLCSARELGLGDDASGLMELPEDSLPGQPVQELLELDDQVFEIDLTPNRGDCLSLAGIAREVGVLNRLAVTPPAIPTIQPLSGKQFPVMLAAPEDCPRYAGRVIQHVDPVAPTPLWMVERLRRAGIRSLGPLVDVTNYVMLELGQPLHAFDLDKLDAGIVVRRATGEESLELLNGQTVTPDEDTLLITDASGPLALAGIMGGARSECDAQTVSVLLESAFFAPLAIAGRARRYGLHTDASHRFERGVDPTLQVRAVERASQLLIAIAGGRAGPLIDVTAPEYLPTHSTVMLRHARLTQVLGQHILPEEVSDSLQRLGMMVKATDAGWRVTPPPFRFDITLEADLIEEIGRVHGYHRLPSRQPLVRLQPGSCPERRLDASQLADALVLRDYQEIISYSFVPADLQQALLPQYPDITLSNPISADLAVMRCSLWPGLIRAMDYNRKRQQERVRLFETGLVFQGDPTAPEQIEMIGGLISGSRLSEQWGAPLQSVDFYDLKGDVAALLALTGAATGFRYIARSHPALHPGQSACIEHQGEPVGWLGALHPALAKQWAAGTGVFLFELRINAWAQAHQPLFQALSKFPYSRRDLAVLLDETMTAERLVETLHKLGGSALRHAMVFDVYRGKGVPEGQKSMACSLIFQGFEDNLTDQAIDRLVIGIVQGLKQELDARLRD